MQSPGCGADVGGEALALGVGEVLGDRAAELAVLGDRDVRQALGAALLGPVLPGVELAARLAAAARHHDRADVVGLEHPERGVLEVVGALDELEAHPEVGLVGAVPRHRVGVRHPRQRALDGVAGLGPHGLQDVLHQRDDVLLVHEAHLDVELGELRLPVGAEVLVAVAARDLVVALHAADHEQLLEQLRALRQGVPAARGQTGRHQEVAGALGRGAGQRGRLDLDEVAGVEHVAGGLVDLAAQAEGGVGAGAAQVEVAVLEAGLLADLAALVAGRVVDGERERVGGREHLDLGRDDLDLAGGEVGVLVALLARDDLADDLQAELAAEAVRDGLVAHDDLHHAAAPRGGPGTRPRRDRADAPPTRRA